MALPNIIYGEEVITYNNSDIEQLQRVENRVYRTILQVPVYTPVEFLRGEVGASSAEYRNIKGKVTYLQSIVKHAKNKLLREIVIDEMIGEQATMKWSKAIKKHLMKIGLSIDDLLQMSTDQVKSHINRKDSAEWHEKMADKQSLMIYRMFKTGIEEVKWFSNGARYSIMMNARANTLKLGWRDWQAEPTRTCKLCKETNEDLKHFLLECPVLEGIRRQYIELQRPRIKDELEIIKNMLMFGSDIGKNGEIYLEMVWRLWNNRRKFLEHPSNM